MISMILAGVLALCVPDLETALERAGENRGELEAAIESSPPSERAGVEWLIEHMPEQDLQSLSADFILENTHEAYEAWRGSPWRDAISEDLFFDTILPYASLNERREGWRVPFREQFAPLVAEATTPAEAAAILNQKIFGMVGVKYSTQRPKPDQSPFESIDAGMASCTGLSVLLVDACRSVGVPARFVGTALWSDGSGNHSWVEVWDDGWHFTGAAEPTGEDLDKGWFAARASGASRDDPQTAIYAVTWRTSPLSFPMVWRAADDSVPAVNVTDRYAQPDGAPEAGGARVRIRLCGADGARIAASFEVKAEGVAVQSGTTRDEGFDANDHATVVLPLGAEATISINGIEHRVHVKADEQLVSLVKPESLSKRDAKRAVARAVRAHEKRIRRERKAEHDARVLRIGEKTMPFWFTTFGKKPREGRSLYISMHGGGGAPPHVNTKQWENQKRLYSPKEGIYVAPRAPTDTWNLWHQGHIDGFFDRLIENMIVFEDVDPNKVYLMGYSAGGDGVFQLAPRMADRFAAAAMMAGHPNETKAEGLRTLPFTIHMGANDAAFNRNGVAKAWKVRLAELHEDDPKGYDHFVEIHAGKGHWMDRLDAAALAWMATKKRRARPDRIVWLQDDVTHERFYWLKTNEPVARRRIDAERDGQTFSIMGEGPLTIRLDESMVDLDEPIIILRNGEEVFRGRAERSLAAIEATLAERGDPSGIYIAEIEVPTK